MGPDFRRGDGSNVYGTKFADGCGHRKLSLLTFAQLIAHLCKTRNARAGTIVGAGAVANKDPKRGYACIADKRRLETSAGGEPVTGFMRFGDTIRIEMLDKAGKSVFGAIEQTVKWRSA